MRNDRSAAPCSWAALAGYLALTLVFSALLTLSIELVVRGFGPGILQFLKNDPRAVATTIVAVALFLWIIDSLVGRTFAGAGLLASLFLVMAAASRVKELFLGSPLYPTDFVFVRQIADLFPLLAANKLFLLVALVAIPVALFLTVGLAVIRFRRGRRLPGMARLAMVAVSVTALAVVGAHLNYRSLSSLRIFLGLNPMVWDQDANYRSNGFLAAFAMNVPMAIVSAPKSYSAASLDAIAPSSGTITVPEERPDIVMVMVESLWDVTRLDKVTIEPDPIPTLRAMASGHSFSPEMGGLTANVEFEALTGFSNAFLPDGSIPYQQFIRRPTPSLASLFGDLGYATRAIHPYKEWFWNRGKAYAHLGFDEFNSLERLPPLEKKGREAADSALTTEIIEEADAMKPPFFFFVVTIQNHGPYRAGRYADATLKVTSPLGDAVAGSIQTYAEGALDADRSLVRLVEWAKKRTRPTVLVMFGDHLPPLADIYDKTGYLHDPAARDEELARGLARERETPLVIWSNRTGVMRDLGSISPAFIPLHLLRQVGVTHPYYTDFLGRLFDEYRVVERRVLFDKDGGFKLDWLHKKSMPDLLGKLWLVEYDQIFGHRYAGERLFPSEVAGHKLSASVGEGAVADEAYDPVAVPALPN